MQVVAVTGIPRCRRLRASSTNEPENARARWRGLLLGREAAKVEAVIRHVPRQSPAIFRGTGSGAHYNRL
jgi:hypothetical protein